MPMLTIFIMLKYNNKNIKHWTKKKKLKKQKFYKVLYKNYLTLL